MPCARAALRAVGRQKGPSASAVGALSLSDRRAARGRVGRGLGVAGGPARATRRRTRPRPERPQGGLALGAADQRHRSPACGASWGPHREVCDSAETLGYAVVVHDAVRAVRAAPSNGIHHHLLRVVEVQVPAAHEPARNTGTRRVRAGRSCESAGLLRSCGKLEAHFARIWVLRGSLESRRSAPQRVDSAGSSLPARRVRSCSTSPISCSIGICTPTGASGWSADSWSPTLPSAEVMPRAVRNWMGLCAASSLTSQQLRRGIGPRDDHNGGITRKS